jgi:hypothetical protein
LREVNVRRFVHKLGHVALAFAAAAVREVASAAVIGDALRQKRLGRVVAARRASPVIADMRDRGSESVGRVPQRHGSAEVEVHRHALAAQRIEEHGHAFLPACFATSA